MGLMKMKPVPKVVRHWWLPPLFSQAYELLLWLEVLRGVVSARSQGGVGICLMRPEYEI